MDKPATNAFARLGATILYALGGWISLTVLILALPWAPFESYLQSARLVLLLVASIVLLVSAIGGTAGLFGLIFGMAPKDPAPRP